MELLQYSSGRKEKREHDHVSSPGYFISFPVPEKGHNLSPPFFSAGCVWFHVSAMSHYTVVSNRIGGTWIQV
jgi:hypothetical protein